MTMGDFDEQVMGIINRLRAQVEAADLVVARLDQYFEAIVDYDEVAEAIGAYLESKK